MSPQAISRCFCKNPLNKSSSPIGAKKTIVTISNNKDKGLSGVRRASNCRKESGAGMTISTNMFISSASIIPPIERNIVAIVTSLEIGFIRRDSIIGRCLRVKKIRTGTIKNA